MAKHEVKIDTTMVQKTPPVKVAERSKPIMNNVLQVRREATGEWYRIARFDTPTAAYNRAASMRKRGDLPRLEFKGVTVDEEEEEDYAEGWRSALYCRWAGVVGDSDAVRPPELRGIDGGADDGAVAPKRRGRPRKATSP